MEIQVQLKRETYLKIMHWINKSSDEVSGFGKVTYHAETGVFEIHDAYLIKQANGAAHTDIDGQDLAKLMYTSRETEGELKWWWHSHVKMQVFWSGTDTATIKELGSQGWCLATVFNQMEDSRSALGYAVSNPVFGNDILIKDELDLFIMDDLSDERTKSWDEEYTSKVQPKVTYTNHNHLLDDRWNEGKWNEGSVNRWSKTYGKGKEEQTTSAYMQEWRHYTDKGWYGAGAYEEAREAGVPYRQYMDMLMSEDGISKEVEDKLDMAIAVGTLVVPAAKIKGVK